MFSVNRSPSTVYRKLTTVKSILSITLFIFLTVQLFGQENKANLPIATGIDFELGKGITLNYGQGSHVFNISGFMQPYYQYEDLDGTSSNQFAIRSAFLTISEKAKKEKMDFVLRVNFAESPPLMDAFINYHATENITLSFGQKQTFANNREMLFLEDKLRHSQRSLLSRSFSETGREFGLFVEGKWLAGNIGIHPKLAVTSGDGRNSFGSTSTDVDRGGLRYAGRLDVYPLGYFAEGNDEVAADFAREETPKILLGAAYSINYGASDKVGEGHGNFSFTDESLTLAYPNYWKQCFDILFKYKGFSLTGEFVNTSADGLVGLYTDASATVHLQNGEISQYLALGQAYNVQLGYVLKNGLAIDGGFSQISPEFPTEINAVLNDTEAYTISLSKYIIDQRFKVQASYSHVSMPSLGTTQTLAELFFQVVF